MIRAAGMQPRFIAFIAFFAVLTLVHHAAVSEWFNRVIHEERYSHAPLIWLVSLYLVWKARAHLSSSGLQRGDWLPGMAVTVVAATGLVVGELSAIWTIVQYSFVLMLLGLAWAMTGKAFKYIWFAFALLFFSIPLPYMIDVIISGRMQLISSRLGAELLRLLDVSVFLEGNIVDLGGYKLQVVEACSGLNYMFPLMAIGIMFVYFYKAPMYVKVLLFLSTVPVTVLMNSARIAVVGLLVNKQGPEAAEGFLHYFEGWAVFMLCLAVLVAEAKLADITMGRKGPLIDSFDLDGAAVAAQRDQLQDGNHQSNNMAVWPVMLVSLVAIALSSINILLEGRDELTPARTSFASFPLELNGWTGASYPFKNREQEILGLDDYIQANYRRGHDEANLYVGYISSQRKGFVPHSPKACIPGGGWEITNANSHTFQTNSGPLHVTKLLIGLGQHQQVVYYWFRQRGRDLADEYAMKFYLLNDSITKQRTDGSLVRIVVPVTRGIVEADRTAQAFLSTFYPVLPQFIPD